MAARREIEVQVFSAQDLRDVRILGGRMSPFAVAWIYPNMKLSSPMDLKGGIAPKWNAKLRMMCDESLVVDESAVIHIELYDSGSYWDTKIGSVVFSLSELPGKKTRDSKGASESVQMALPIRRRYNHEQGTLNFSVRIGHIVSEDEQGEELSAANSMSNTCQYTGCCGLPHFQTEEKKMPSL